MPLTKLEHYLILADDVESTKNFYVEVLGMRVGERPPFPFPGYWLYLGGAPCVHLASSAADPMRDEYLGLRARGTGTGPLDHVAFTAVGLRETLERLEGLGIEVLRRTVPEQRSHQVFIEDPNGIKIELNFEARELADLDPV